MKIAVISPRGEGGGDQFVLYEKTLPKGLIPYAFTAYQLLLKSETPFPFVSKITPYGEKIKDLYQLYIFVGRSIVELDSFIDELFKVES